MSVKTEPIRKKERVRGREVDKGRAKRLKEEHRPKVGYKYRNRQRN